MRRTARNQSQSSSLVAVPNPGQLPGPDWTGEDAYGRRKLHGYFFALGEYDGVAIVEFPDHITAVACSMSAAATSAFARFETTALLTAQEAETAMKKAQSAKTNYRAPNA